MKITYGSRNQKIENYGPNPLDESDWTSHYKNSDSNHSAWLLGRFVFQENGLNQIQNIIEKSLSTSVTFEKCTVEKSIKFDEFPRPSMRDLVLEGKTATGISLFASIEAKAAEDFGPIISSALKSADKNTDNHQKSNKRLRITNLL